MTEKYGLPMHISTELFELATRPTFTELLAVDLQHAQRAMSDPTYRWQGPLEEPAAKCARIGHDWNDEVDGYPEADAVSYGCLRCDAVLTYTKAAS